MIEETRRSQKTDESLRPSRRSQSRRIQRKPIWLAGSADDSIPARKGPSPAKRLTQNAAGMIVGGRYQPINGGGRSGGGWSHTGEINELPTLRFRFESDSKRHTALPSKPLRVVGIDDWSWMKGTRYGTIVVDLERREVVDVLHDRSVKTTAAWLGEHPTIEIVSRDRCGLYARAARQGAAQARQVADRFHLIQNLRQAIEQQLSRDHQPSKPMRDKAIPRPAAATVAHDEVLEHRQMVRHGRRDVWQERFNQVKELQRTGRSLNAIVEQTGDCRKVGGANAKRAFSCLSAAGSGRVVWIWRLVKIEPKPRGRLWTSWRSIATMISVISPGLSRHRGDHDQSDTTGRVCCRLGIRGWNGCCDWLERRLMVNPEVST
jgi:hypothetical protein